MTAKTLRNKGGTDYTRGVSREQRAINRRNKLESSMVPSQSSVPKSFAGNKRAWYRLVKSIRECKAAHAAYCNFEDNLTAIAVQRFGEPFRDREVSNVAFEERPFGDLVKPGQINCPFTASYAEDLSSLVVSIALFDGDKMLFACSGMPLRRGRTRARLTRFVTSAHLVKVFNENRNKDDKLRVAVRLTNSRTTDGFLGLYDEDIAIVTCSGVLGVCPLDLKAAHLPDRASAYVQAAGRAFNSGNLMAMRGSMFMRPPYMKRLVNTWAPDKQDISKAVLGGPLLGSDKKIIGINLDTIYDPRDAVLRYKFLPMDLLRERLKHFQILNPKKLHFRGYTLPRNVSSVVPSGFMHTICRLKSGGYPMPPPLVLEFNGVLINHFEECFGEVLRWKGYPFPGAPGGSGERVWDKLPKEIVTDLSRCVVSLASFNGYVRSFACTGLLIKWHGSKAKNTVILTSASLVRDRHYDDNIDNSLTIEVFLPPNQRAGGTLEFYNLDYNIAIVSLNKNFNAIRSDDIFIENAHNSSEKVVAIGRDPKFGLLMAASGEVKPRNKGCKVDCKDVQLSTCKITKAGIGGPLINLDGSFVGMNFYDGSDVTPFLPRHKIVQVLSGVNSLPSECGYDHPMHVNVRGGTTERIQKNRWPVPEPYWYHGALDVDFDDDIPKHIGRRLN